MQAVQRAGERCAPSSVSSENHKELHDLEWYLLPCDCQRGIENAGFGVCVRSGKINAELELSHLQKNNSRYKLLFEDKGGEG